MGEHIKIISNKIPKNMGVIRKIAHRLPSKIYSSAQWWTGPPGHREKSRWAGPPGPVTFEPPGPLLH